MTLAGVAAALWTGAVIGVPSRQILFGYAGILWLMIPFVVLIAIVPWGIRAWILRVENPWSEFKPILTERFGSRARTAGTAGPILLMPMLMGSFGCLNKSCRWRARSRGTTAWRKSTG